MYKHHTTEEKLALLELSDKLNNVARACQTMGFSRDSYYRIKKAYEEGDLKILTSRKTKLNKTKETVSSNDKKGSLEARLKFETLISELSAHFINLPVNRIDAEIENGQKKVCEALGLNRSLFLEYSRDTHLLTTTHAWIAPEASKLYPPALTDDYAYFVNKLMKGQIFYFSDPDELPDEVAGVRDYARLCNATSTISVPFMVGEHVIGMIYWESRVKREWPEDLRERLRLISEVFANALSRKRSEEALIALKDQLQAENLYLLDEIKLEYKHHEIIGQSKSIISVLNQIEKVAPTNSSVLILGETGTGKELVAHAIHNLSPCKNRHMVKVNCAALPSTLIESELFGHEKGAYTGAVSRKLGRFEVANGSTIFLDEVGDLPLLLQPKLLRVLQEGQFERLGGSETITVNARVIAATNRDLTKAVSKGTFREDLYYRLNIFPISVPPLRDRKEDIPLLIKTFIKEFSTRMGKTVDSVSNKSFFELNRYTWPGNVRELRNLIEREMILTKGRMLHLQLPEVHSKETTLIETLDNIQRKHIIKALEHTRWRIAGPRGAAELLGIKPTTLHARMKRLGIRREQKFC